MVNRFSELRNKEVIHVCEGYRDWAISTTWCIDIDTGRVTAIMVPGPCRFLGLFGRDSRLCHSHGGCIRTNRRGYHPRSKVPIPGWRVLRKKRGLF